MCCKQQRSNLSAKPSSLIGSMKVIMCNSCKRSNHEPRHIIVIAAKSGIDVGKHVKEHQYCGRSLEAVEVLP